MIIFSLTLNVVLVMIIIYMKFNHRHKWEVESAFIEKETWHTFHSNTGAIVPNSDYNLFMVNAKLKCSDCGETKNISKYKSGSWNKSIFSKIMLFLNENG